MVLQYSVQIMFMVAALNELDLQAADTKNTYLIAPCHEKIWTIDGLKLGIDEEMYSLWFGPYKV